MLEALVTICGLLAFACIIAMFVIWDSILK